MRYQNPYCQNNSNHNSLRSTPQTVKMVFVPGNFKELDQLDQCTTKFQTMKRKRTINKAKN